jgi:hypothetical protein
MFQNPIGRPLTQRLDLAARVDASTTVAAISGRLIRFTGLSALGRGPDDALMLPCCSSDGLIVSTPPYPTEYLVLYLLDASHIYIFYIQEEGETTYIIGRICTVLYYQAMRAPSGRHQGIIRVDLSAMWCRIAQSTSRRAI